MSYVGLYINIHAWYVDVDVDVGAGAGVGVGACVPPIQQSLKKEGDAMQTPFPL